MRWLGWACAATVVVGGGCDRPMDAPAFRRAIERSYLDVHPGWTLARRKDGETWFVRGDQIDRLKVVELFAAYEAQKKPAKFIDEWRQAAEARRAARRRSLGQASTSLLPMIKSEDWLKYQELGAIGPAHLRDRIRPWRQPLSGGLYVLLGVPEGDTGIRYASIQEVESSTVAGAKWLERASAYVYARYKDVEPASLHGKDGTLRVLQFGPAEGISALVLSPRFRRRVLGRFGQATVGVAIPTRDHLTVFDAKDFVTLKPIRVRTHALYDAKNYPAFRGLLRMDQNGVSILEPAHPEKKSKGPR